MNQNKTRFYLKLLALAIFIALPFVAFYAGMKFEEQRFEGIFSTPSTVSPTPTPFLQSVSSGTANWKTYRNEKYGFEFKYPSDYKFLENTAFDIKDKASKFQIWIDKDLSSAKPRAFELLIKDIGHTSLSLEVNSFKNNFENVMVSQKKLDGNDFTVVSLSDGANTKIETAYIEHNGFLYIIDYNQESKNFLNSFKFTK